MHLVKMADEATVAQLERTNVLCNSRNFLTCTEDFKVSVLMLLGCIHFGPQLRAVELYLHRENLGIGRHAEPEVSRRVYRKFVNSFQFLSFRRRGFIATALQGCSHKAEVMKKPSEEGFFVLCNS